FDPDLGRIDASTAVDPVAHRARPEDDDDHQNHLQYHPRNGAPVDFRGLDRPRRDAAQIKQGKAEGRVHEARLNVRADQHAEPDEIDAELVGNRRQKRNDDERDLEEIEEECDHEHESIDEDQKPDLSPRQRRQHILDPYLSADALEDETEGARADQNVDHHGGDAHGG